MTTTAAGDAAVARLNKATESLEKIITGASNQVVDVPGYGNQPTLAARVDERLDETTATAAAEANRSRDKADIATNQATAAANSVTLATAEFNKAKTQADRAQSEADRAALIAGLDTVADAVRLAVLPAPDVSIPFTTDGQLLHGKGTPVLVGTTPVAQMVSYERLGSQTMLDKSGRLVTVPAGEMAIEQQGLAIFDQSVNMAAPSINWVGTLAAAPWVHSAKDESGWITVSGSGSVSAIEGSFVEFDVMTPGVPHTFSLDILKSSGMQVRIQVQDAGADRPSISITETGASGIGSESVYDMGSFWRVELTRSFLSSSYRKFRIYPFGAEIGSSGSMAYRRIQVEAKQFSTPYIENATSAQTARPATTRCDIPWLGNLLPISDNQHLTIAMEFDTSGIPLAGVSHTLFTQSGGLGQNVIGRVENGGMLRFYRGSPATHQVSVLSRRRYRICLRVNRNVCDLFMDGVKAGSTVTAPPVSAGINDVLRIGCSSTPDRCLNGHLRSITIWNTPLTDIQCQAASS
ncbi:hypothetical protein RF663_04425 [Aeromonas veronii]|uniref:phage head spike fiber domain-containing protein n=1 Tax=Aeromonas veronii TaxID=654 RepID=UPI0028533913|nr:LamG-like jellyroll fold domain-containing protein [Aeromonas veronii]MDR5013494.1 hypothetical protein [Aeromonas veronii]